MLYTMPKALLLHPESDNHLPATTVDALDILLLNVILNKEIKNDLETEAEIIIIVTEAMTDLEAETETILDLTIEIDHETGIDLEVMITILEIEITLENEIATIPMLITIGDPQIAHLLLTIVMSTTLIRTPNLLLL